MIDSRLFPLHAGWLPQRDRDFVYNALNGVIIDGGQNIRRRDCVASFRNVLLEVNSLELYADCECQFGEAFYGVRLLLRPLLEGLQREKPSLLADHRPEILAVWPEWYERKFFAGTPPIEMIALGGTKRRLHKDSEQLFRIIHALASIVLSATRPGGYAANGLSLIMDNFDAADRLSISFVFHLLHRLRDEPVFVLMSVDRSWYDRPLSRNGPWLWGRCRGPLKDTTYFEKAYRLHAKALRLLETAPRICVISDSISPTSETLEEPRNERISRYVNFRAFGASETCGTELAGIDKRHMTSGPRINLTRSALQLLRERTGQAERTQIIKRLISAHENMVSDRAIREHLLLPISFFSSLCDDSHKAVTATLASLDACFSFSLNFEVMLLMAAECREAIGGYSSDASENQALNLAAGLVYCFVEEFEMSLASFEGVLLSEAHPVIKSQACFYAGLVRAKMQDDLTSSASLLKKGQKYVQKIESWQAAVEFGWCSNALAFCEWKSGNFAAAEAILSEALQYADLFKNPQIENLRVNLVNNLSVLLEDGGDITRAKSTWESLNPLIEIIPGGRFSKSYHYRLGWLQLQSGNRDEALAQYAVSYKTAETYHDVFHMDIITSALGYVSMKNRDLEGALRWYRLNEAQRLSLGDLAGACSSAMSLSSLEYLAGDIIGAASRASNISQIIGNLEGSKSDALLMHLHSLKAVIESDQQGQFENEAGLHFPRPKRKLTTPFGVIHMIASRDGASDRHRSFVRL